MSSTLVKHSRRTVRVGCYKCGSKTLYWAHDTSRPDDHCNKCDVSGKMTLIEPDGERHSVSCPGSYDATPIEDEDETVTVAPAVPVPAAVVPAVPPAVPAGSPDAFAAFQLFMDTLAPKVDRAEVEAIVKEAFDNVVFPTRTVVERSNGTTVTIDGTHPMVADVIIDLLAGEHVMMVGPAGTGKSTIAEHAAESLGLAFYAISLSPMTPASSILGYQDANGNTIRTLYREAYENGGVFHFDEIDNSHPSVLAVVNASLSNGQMAFPDGMVKRHADFRCVASANTYGKGADRQYVGRQQIDAATLDRFTIETIEVDESLEADICKSTGADEETVTKVLAYVRRLRATAARKGMSVVMSPRASVGMCRLIAAGKSWDKAVAGRVRRGMSDADWSKLTN